RCTSPDRGCSGGGSCLLSFRLSCRRAPSGKQQQRRRRRRAARGGTGGGLMTWWLRTLGLSGGTITAYGAFPCDQGGGSGTEGSVMPLVHVWQPDSAARPSPTTASSRPGQQRLFFMIVPCVGRMTSAAWRAWSESRSARDWAEFTGFTERIEQDRAVGPTRR